MNLAIDNRPSKSLFTDRENNCYAENDKITRMINCDNKDTATKLIFSLLFDVCQFSKDEYIFLETLFNICIKSNKNEIYKAGFITYLSKIYNRSIRTYERYIKKFIAKGILINTVGVLHFTQFYNPLNIKTSSDFIVIEVNPNKNNKITL